MATGFQVRGRNPAALFTLKVHRGDGMVLLGMNWRPGRPPNDFVGFAVEYKEPGGDRFYAVKNRLSFPGAGGEVSQTRLSTLLAPIQMFRWVHFPRNAELPGTFQYRVTPVFMNDKDELSYGEAQEAGIELRRDTYPGKLNVAFTRGFISSQAFVDTYAAAGPIDTLLPATADVGLSFTPSHPKASAALAWMGFEARRAILDVLDQAIADPAARVSVVAYDLNEPAVLARLERLGTRLRVIIDDDGDHGRPGSAEAEAERRLTISAGAGNVRRQHLGKLQHNKTIVVDGPQAQLAVCGSTNFSWRGLYVQSNSALVLHGPAAAAAFDAAFDAYWQSSSAADFSRTASAQLTTLAVGGVDVQIGFSPYTTGNALLARIGADIEQNTRSSLLYSLAFLYQTQGAVRAAITKLTQEGRAFVYGVSDRRVGGISVQKPSGTIEPVSAAALGANAPEPFRSEPTGGGGTRMHHKFVVIDFDKPTARVYVGSYNFSTAADSSNGENLLLIRDRRVAVSYAIEALRIIDHYHFRLRLQEGRSNPGRLALARPPRQPGDLPWWEPFYSDPHKIRDRMLFS